MPDNTLKITDLRATVDGSEILKGLSLTIPKGEVHAIMGPNGSGKSPLSKVLAGHEDYEVTNGSITMDGIDISRKPPRARRALGLLAAPEERLGHAAAPNMSLTENAMLTGSVRQKLENRGFLSWSGARTMPIIQTLLWP